MVSLNEIPYKIALYIRVSTEEQAESPEGSIKNQEERLRRTVRDKIEDGSDAEIVGVFIDAGLSGKDTNRPQLQKMLARIRRGEINLVMVTELSRLSRNTKDFGEMWEVFHQYKCEFHSLREKFDTTNAAGEMMLHMMINFAQFERRQTAERIAASFRVRAERGLYNGGCVPLGYRIPEDKSGKLLVHEEEAEIVRTAFKAFLDRESLSLAVTWLNENNIRFNRKMIGGGRPRTGHFLFESLHKILRNKAYIGIRVYRTNEGLKETKAAWPAIVDDITFQRVQEILTKNYRRKKPATPNRYPYQLTSLIVCGVCGDRLCGKSAWGKRKKIPYYEHSWISKIQNALPEKVYTCKPHRIPGTIAETIVWREVESVLTNPKVAEDLILEAKAIHARFDNSSEIDRLKNKIYGVTAQLDALTERLSLLPMEVSAEPIFKHMKKLELQKQDLEAKHYEMKNQGVAQDLPVSLSKYDEFVKAITTWKPNETPTPEQKRKVIERLVDKIEIYPDEIKISFIMGSSKIERELTLIGSLSNPVKTVTKPLEKYLKTQCSTSLTVGGGGSPSP